MAAKGPKNMPHSERKNLLRACADGDAASVRRILAKRKPVREVELRRKDNHGWSALHHAVASNSLDCVQLLMQQTENNPNLKNFEGETALFLAVKNSRVSLDIVKVLLTGNRPDAVHNNNEEVPLLHRAVDSKRLDVLQVIVENGADINVKDLDGDTCLHLAAYNGGDEAIIDYILSWPDFDAAQKNEAGLRPLVVALQHWESYAGPEALFGVVEKLLPRTFSVVDNRGFHSPLDLLEPALTSLMIPHDFVREDPLKIFRFFLERGGYFDNQVNSLYPLLKFFMDNFPETITIFSPAINTAPPEECKALYFFIQLALHDQVLPNLKMLVSFISDDETLFVQNSMTFGLQNATDSDAHLAFAIDLYHVLQRSELAEKYHASVIVFSWLDQLLNLLFECADVDRLARCHKLLDLCRTEGVDFDEVLSKLSMAIPQPYPEMLAPFCLKHQLNVFNTDALEIGYQWRIATNPNSIPVSKMPNWPVATLKFWCRKRILRNHEHMLDRYFESVAQLELPEVLRDYLCFKLSKTDYLRIKNQCHEHVQIF